MDAAHGTYDRWTDRLSEYLDGELDAGERAALELHLATCGDCALALDELRAVIAAAQALEDAPPEHDLWAGIEARLGPVPGSTLPEPAVISLSDRRRRFSFTLPQLAAAGIAVVALSSTLVWLVTTRLGGSATTSPPVVAAIPTTSGVAGQPLAAGIPAEGRQPEATTSPAAPLAGTPAPLAAAEPRRGPRATGARLVRAERVADADRQYDRAVADMERLLRHERSRLRPETVRALETSLVEIDRAIADARRALAADPANIYLSDHLAESMRLKLELLRQATALAQS